MIKFEEIIEEMGLTGLQKIKLRLAAGEYAGREWQAGFEKSQEIMRQTMGIFKK